MTYKVKSIFPTIQGEGFHAGRAAVFVRFAGCNLWSGHDENRHRDSWRNDALCPTWCDTDFVGGDKVSADDIAATVAGHWAGKGAPADRLIVLTGGEPFLQLDDTLLEALKVIAGTVAIETNGTIALDPSIKALDPWITMSPKRARAKTALTSCSEIKLVVPGGQSIEDWDDFPAGHRFVQPCDPTAMLGTVINPDQLNLVKRTTRKNVMDIVRQHPKWRLSLQMHKELGIP
jgi:organic radical activating enzyme